MALSASQPGGRSLPVLTKRMINGLSLPSWSLLGLLFFTGISIPMDGMGAWPIMSVIAIAIAPCMLWLFYDAVPSWGIWRAARSATLLAAIVAVLLAIFAYWLRFA